jgi:hypothetical protein
MHNKVPDVWKNCVRVPNDFLKSETVFKEKHLKTTAVGFIVNSNAGYSERCDNPIAVLRIITLLYHCI